MRNLYQVILFYVLLPTWYSLRVDLSDIEVCEEDGVEEDLVSPAFDDPLLLWVVYFWHCFNNDTSCLMLH